MSPLSSREPIFSVIWCDLWCSNGMHVCRCSSRCCGDRNRPGWGVATMLLSSGDSSQRRQRVLYRSELHGHGEHWWNGNHHLKCVYMCRYICICVDIFRYSALHKYSPPLDVFPRCTVTNWNSSFLHLIKSTLHFLGAKKYILLGQTIMRTKKLTSFWCRSIHPLTQYLVEATPLLLLGYVSTIFAHLQMKCSPILLGQNLKLIQIGWRIFKSYHRFSVGLRCGLWLGHFKPFRCSGSLSRWKMNLCPSL